MKSNGSILKKGIALWVMTVLLTFTLKACGREKVEFPEGSIIITTTAKELRIALSGSDDIAIHWGDGKKSNLNEGDPLDLPGGYVISHTYSSNAKRTIYITGKVETLHCVNMQLTALDVSQNPELIALNCSDNQLTELDVSKNTALKFLRCNNNLLTTLDVSKIATLQELHIKGNQITTLDVSLNTALKDLNCNDNHITHVDLKGNTQLNLLNINRNQLTKLDLSKNTSLRGFCIQGNQFTASALNDLFKTLFYVPEGEFSVLNYSSNPGSKDADRSIWEEKNWLYSTCFP
jgi:hypothetical protein